MNRTSAYDDMRKSNSGMAHDLRTMREEALVAAACFAESFAANRLIAASALGAKIESRAPSIQTENAR